MEFLAEQIDTSAVGVLLLPLLLVAGAVALALFTGLAARIAMFIEELPHRRAAEARVPSSGWNPSRH